ncbi:MAG: carboxypeptidase regulatory-like domain-containing protein [Acidimicrobiales bacterium]
MGIALLVVASLVGLLASPASAATGTLSGTVSDSSAAPIGGATVDVFEATWGIPAGSTTTQPDGTYSLAVAPGTYRVRFTHPTHAETWSGSATSWVTSSAITIDDGATTARRHHGRPRHHRRHRHRPRQQPRRRTHRRAALHGPRLPHHPHRRRRHLPTTDVPNATFTLGFRDPTGTTWAMEYSGGSNTETGATRITTTGGTTHTIDHTVHHGGSISGTNGIGDTGPGVAGLYVVALDVDHLEIVGAAATDTNGAWQIDNLPPGDVTIATIDPAALSATSYNSYRLVFRPERTNVDTLGLANAWTTATHYPITTGTTTPTGRQPLRPPLQPPPTTPAPTSTAPTSPTRTTTRLQFAGSQRPRSGHPGTSSASSARATSRRQHRGRVCVRELLRTGSEPPLTRQATSPARTSLGWTSRSRSFPRGRTSPGRGSLAPTCPRH